MMWAFQVSWVSECIVRLGILRGANCSESVLPTCSTLTPEMGTFNCIALYPSPPCRGLSELLDQISVGAIPNETATTKTYAPTLRAAATRPTERHRGLSERA